MRRRFGRGRRERSGGSAEGRGAPIDAARALERIVAAGVAGASRLEVFEDPEVPAHFAALGRGEGSSGPLLLACSPRHGGDAALAALAVGLRLAADEDFAGEVVAVAPEWSVAARRRLALLGGARLRAVGASALGDDAAGGRIEPEEDAAMQVVPLRQAGAGIEPAAERELFGRTVASLEGLAAKHGGSVRGVPGGAELVLLARRAAWLRHDGGLVLETADRSRLRPADGLANAMDRLEGLVRKQLNDRRIRGSEEGARAELAGILAAAAGLRAVRLWPLPGSDPEVLDVLGVASDGVPVAGAIRTRLGLVALGEILDAAAGLRPALSGLLAAAEPPLRLGTLRLALAAESFDGAALRVLSALALPCEAYDVSRRGREPGLSRRALDAAAAPPAQARPEPPREAAAPEAAPMRPPERPRRFDEVSIFDLDDGAQAADADAPPQRRRRRGRRRRGGRRGAPAAAATDEDADASPPRESDRGPRPERERPSEEEALDDLDLSGTLTPLDDDVPEPEERTLPSYDDDDDDDEESDSAEPVPALDPGERLQADREARRQERLAEVDAEAESELEAEPETRPPSPRRRSAIVVHADRDSILAGILLARDLRLVEGFWVYPQTELMTFFRSVATDLRDATPIYLIGFTATPARDTIQAASLYAGRLDWFDHHEWPPEDLESLRAAIGSERVFVFPGSGSSVPPVLSVRARRSRFSDKLVELASGAFTLHDYERWGRVWWHRVGELAGRPGERRADVDPLLVGRPSELAREAGRAPTPPPPPEAEYVAGRDFRLVHFGGYALVLVPVPEPLDMQLTARIARERYASALSLAHRDGEELLVLGGDESRGRHGLDLAGMVEYLDSKHEWIEALPEPDRVARLRVRGLAEQPERLDEVIREIAMGRSVLEG